MLQEGRLRSGGTRHREGREGWTREGEEGWRIKRELAEGGEVTSDEREVQFGGLGRVGHLVLMCVELPQRLQ